MAFIWCSVYLSPKLVHGNILCIEEQGASIDAFTPMKKSFSWLHGNTFIPLEADNSLPAPPPKKSEVVFLKLFIPKTSQVGGN